MSIVEEARTNGELVYEFNQGQSAVCTQPGPWGNAYSGFCAGMAMKWLSLRRQSQDFEHDKESKKLAMPHWHATRDQNVYEDKDFASALAQYGLAVAANTRHWNGSPNSGSLRQIAEGTSGLYLIVLWRAGGGHAVAMQSEVDRSMYRFLDANYGHFVFLSAERFGQWLGGFLDRSGYGSRYNAGGEVYPIA